MRAPVDAATSVTIEVTADSTIPAVDRRGEPTTVGVAFGPGEAPATQTWSLTDERGRSVPVQVRPLDHWADGSIRWLLVDFQADVSAGGVSRYELRPGTGTHAAPESPLQVDVAEQAITVRTGAAEFQIGRTGHALFSSVAGRRRAGSRSGRVRNRGNGCLGRISSPRDHRRRRRALRSAAGRGARRWAAARGRRRKRRRRRSTSFLRGIGKRACGIRGDQSAPRAASRRLLGSWRSRLGVRPRCVDGLDCAVRSRADRVLRGRRVLAGEECGRARDLSGFKRRRAVAQRQPCEPSWRRAACVSRLSSRRPRL